MIFYYEVPDIDPLLPAGYYHSRYENIRVLRIATRMWSESSDGSIVLGKCRWTGIGHTLKAKSKEMDEFFWIKLQAESL